MCAASGGAYVNRANGLELVDAYAFNGADVAHIYDSPDDETFQAGEDWGRLSCAVPEFDNGTDDFGTVHVYGTAGGTNTMLLPIDPLAYALVPRGTWV